MIHKRYSKNGLQLLLKNWLITITQKLGHPYTSKSDPELLLIKNWLTNIFQNWPTKVTQNRFTKVTYKVIHNCYSKIGPQSLFKEWSTNITQILGHKRYSKLTHKCYSKLTQKRYSKSEPQRLTLNFYSKISPQLLLESDRKWQELLKLTFSSLIF